MKSKGIQLDRMSPNTALAQIVTILNGIFEDLSKTGITLNDFINLAVSDITTMAGTFDSKTFEDDYRKHITDIMYPVGSFYETSDADFDPNDYWSGTWELEEEGLVHIGAGENYTLGDTGGEAEHTLTVDEIPSHRHSMADRWSEGTGSETAYKRDTNRDRKTIYTEYEGGDGAHNNMQPYIVVNRWHRTA